MAKSVDQTVPLSKEALSPLGIYRTGFGYTMEVEEKDGELRYCVYSSKFHNRIYYEITEEEIKKKLEAKLITKIR